MRQTYLEYKAAPDNWMGQVPSHWRLERIKYGLTEKKSKKKTNLPPGAISYGRVVSKDADKIGPETLETYQEVLTGEYLINPINLNYDLVSLRTALSKIDVCVSPAYIVLNAVSDKVVPGFGNYILHVFDVCHMKTLGAGIRQTITFNDIGQCVWPLPPRGEQAAIARFLDRETRRIDDLITEKGSFIELLDQKEKAAISRFVRCGINPKAELVDSKFEWRGQVPSHWTRGRMKNHFRQVKRQGFDNLTVLSVYREFGVIEKASRDDNINKTPEDLSKYQLVEPNDLAINKMKAWQGSMGVSPYLGITSPDYVVMTPIGKHDPRYMHHYLRPRPMPWVYRLISNGIRTDQWRLEPEKFLELPIYLPPLKEQQAIADKIDCELEHIRSLIATTERSIELLKEKRSALIAAAVTGKIDVRSAA